MKSLRIYILAASFAVSLITFVGFSLLGSVFFEKLTVKQASQLSEAIATQTFSSMYQVMKKGWTRQELEEFARATKNAFESSPLDVTVFRGKKVQDLYGKALNDVRSDQVQSVLEEGELFKAISEKKITYVYPIIAKQECTQCHTNAHEGDVLGAIQIDQDTEEMLAEAKEDFYWILLFMIPVPFVVAFFVGNYLVGKVDQSVESFRDEINSINSVGDLSALELGSVDIGFKEMNIIFDEVGILVARLQEVAADKELLEFEVKLLDKFIITSDVVRDWKEHVGDLLIEINSIMEAYSLFVIFKIEEEIYDLEIFWKNRPTENTKTLFEESVRKRIGENPYFSTLTQITIHHHIANDTINLPDLTMKDIELQTKSLILSTPKIGGVVGIGVQSLINQDPTRYIVIESILTTLVNVVGSVKAIFKYTKDLEYYATRDPLTNLFNQRVFRELLYYEIGRAKRHRYKFGLLMIDFDNFKLINDRYGHQFGDQFLQEFGGQIKGALRLEDILARYGGDEFTVILPEADAEQVFMIADKLRSTLEKMTLTAPTGESVKGTISVGGAVYPDHGKDDKELFLIADNMMYKSKRAGKNRISLPSEEDVMETFKVAGEKTQLILNSLETKENLIPFFQPIMDVYTKEVAIYEMLMRINYNNKLYSANEFVDIAESLGAIHKMDYALIEKAMYKIAHENYQGMLFVNLSPKSLIVGEYLANIYKLAIQYDISPERIVFEITERDSIKNVTLLEKFVQELKLEGFKFAIDNFGSGFSSFQYLKRLPVDYLKIEGDFIRNILKDNRDRAFISSILKLAKELEIKTVAEFVEEEEVLNELSSMGVDYVQGYLVGKPSENLHLGG